MGKNSKNLLKTSSKELSNSLIEDNLQDHSVHFNDLNRLKELTRKLATLADNFQSCEYDKEQNIIMVTVTPAEDDGYTEVTLISKQELDELKTLLGE